MRIVLTDYGIGNIHSTTKVLEVAEFDVDVVIDMSKLPDAGCMMFSGVGAFDCTMERLLPVKDEVRKRLESGVPALSVCIGAQIMFPTSEEEKGPRTGTEGACGN